MAKPVLWLFAGPNGAGKSTFTRFPELSSHIRHFLNADELTRELLQEQGYSSFLAAPSEVLRQTNLVAAEKIFAQVIALLEQGEVVSVETVLSTDKYRCLVERLRREGGSFNLIYVALRSPELSRERVARRVARGGHPVPEEKLPARWRRSLDHLPWFARQADRFLIYDNSDSDQSIKPPLIARNGTTPGRLRLLDREANPAVTEILLRSGLWEIES